MAFTRRMVRTIMAVCEVAAPALSSSGAASLASGRSCSQSSPSSRGGSSHQTARSGKLPLCHKTEAPAPPESRYHPFSGTTPRNAGRDRQ
jgi:hypothetical protein